MVRDRHTPVKRWSHTYWLGNLKCFGCCDKWFPPLRCCLESAEQICFPADIGRPEAWMCPWKDKLLWRARHRWSSASAIAAEMSSCPALRRGLGVVEVLGSGNELSTVEKSIICSLGRTSHREMQFHEPMFDCHWYCAVIAYQVLRGSSQYFPSA